ncbi:MAG TPA: hydrogenase/urease maturation nickel metallochaperone HypA [Candidatus Dormibacteraeota bacterium]|nr:hydrogenase/urease maturation nickel metallochaperone HypA [Candidatus Dormibacteraeota bacterium]
MHEAGLAAAVATAIRDEGLVGRRVRIVVTGGHDEPSAFDEALRFHLSGALPEVDAASLWIVHEPSEHWCSACGRRFEALWGEACPACGGTALPAHLDEELAIEPAEDLGPRNRAGPSAGPGPSDPWIGDGIPSAGRAAPAQAGTMEGSGLGVDPNAPMKRPDEPVT